MFDRKKRFSKYIAKYLAVLWQAMVAAELGNEPFSEQNALSAAHTAPEFPELVPTAPNPLLLQSTSVGGALIQLLPPNHQIMRAIRCPITSVRVWSSANVIKSLLN